VAEHDVVLFERAAINGFPPQKYGLRPHFFKEVVEILIEDNGIEPIT